MLKLEVKLRLFIIDFIFTIFQVQRLYDWKTIGSVDWHPTRLVVRTSLVKPFEEILA